jgi:hypothetical protein
MVMQPLQQHHVGGGTVSTDRTHICLRINHLRRWCERGAGGTQQARVLDKVLRHQGPKSCEFSRFEPYWFRPNQCPAALFITSTYITSEQTINVTKFNIKEVLHVSTRYCFFGFLRKLSKMASYKYNTSTQTVKKINYTLSATNTVGNTAGAFETAFSRAAVNVGSACISLSS